MPEAKLNWSTARVQDGELAVELKGDIEKGWKKSFKTTVRLLGHGEWGEVVMKKRAIRVAHVAPGTEEKLRHYLESLVAQANASQSADNQVDRDEEHHAPADDGPDAEMTEQFRSFADAQPADNDPREAH
jgi:hypothetical protein